MPRRANRTPQAGFDLLEGFGCLAGEVGDAVEVVRAKSSTARARSSDSLSVLRRFLERYHQQTLIARELPIICQAYHHATRNEIRELIVLDVRLAQEPAFESFANASRNVGTTHLKRLRPLRDQRLVRRYLQAVESGEARGWHTVVYGLILALYSIPLRQGLLNYGRETMRGFITSANASLKLLEVQCQQLHDELCLRLPSAVESLLAQNSLIAC